MPGRNDRRVPPRRRSDPLRTGIVLAVALPSILLSCLWGYTMERQLSDTLSLRAQTQFAQRLGGPLHILLNRMQDERRLTAVWQAGQHPADRTALSTGRAQTDAAVADFRAASSSPSGADPVNRAELQVLNGQLQQLTAQRAAVDSGRVTAAVSLDWYKEFIQQGMAEANDLAGIGDAQYGRAAASAYIVVQVTERLAREDAEVAAALTTGRMSASVHTNFAAVASARRDLITSGNVSDLPTAADFQKVVSSPAWTQLNTIETAIIGGASPGITSGGSGSFKLPAVASGWNQADAQVRAGLIQALDQGWSRTLADASNRVGSQLLAIAGGTAFFLATALFTILWTRRLARRIVERLADLRQSARDLAENRLPDLVDRVNRGEPVDVRAELTPQDYGDDELGRTATEVTATQLAAVASAVQRARSSEGTRQVFVNLARRTQVLVHRQIAGLDRLERETEDAETLGRLFEVDHIATRIRRNAENLAILGGAVTARQWRTGVALVNVVRSAVSEVEDYARVKVHPAPNALLTGPAVTDVIHLLAELIENGTHFSPPHTQVTVTTQEVPSGCVIEVEDRGLGMAAEEYDRINALLADPPDPGTVLTGDDPRLGLYVVARLAHRHGVRVSLRKSPYGGSCAIVLLPPALIEAPARQRTVPDDAVTAIAANEAAEFGAAPEHYRVRSLPAWPGTATGSPALRPGGQAPAALSGGAAADATDGPAAGSLSSRLQRVGGRHAAPKRGADTFAAPAVIPSTSSGTPAADDGAGHLFRSGRPASPGAPSSPAAPATRGVPAAQVTTTTRPVQAGAAPGAPAAQAATEGAPARVLPKRVKQASLARQMREAGGGTEDFTSPHPYPSDADTEFDVGGRAPERSRLTMAAIQRGTRRGRDASAPPPTPDDSSTAQG